MRLRRDGAQQRAGERPDFTPRWQIVGGLFRPGMNMLMGKDWHGLDTLPDTGYIAVANHVSEVDPIAVGHVVFSGGNTPHFMAKESLFRVPALGALMRSLKQIPVARGDRFKARESLELAKQVLAEGGAIIIYPEGTLTRDPDLWPMRAKTGAARLALNTGVPLVPITHWGLQSWLPQYARLPRLLPRKRYTLRVGAPVDLSDLRDRPLTRTVLAEATERIEAALTEGVAQLRGQTPPENIWDAAVRQRIPRGQLKAKAAQEEKADQHDDEAGGDQ